jgi:hypothetical protein
MKRSDKEWCAQALRAGTLEMVRDWESDDFRLEIFETGIRPLHPRTICETYLAYRFYDKGVPIFEGYEYLPSPLHCIDSDASVAGLLTWLSLGDGDTDDEYFESYTPEQIAWRDDRADDLQLESVCLEESCRADARDD